MKKANRNNNYYFEEYQNDVSLDENISDEKNYNDELTSNEFKDNEEITVDSNQNNYKVIDKNSKFKILIIIVVCIVISLILVIGNAISTHKQVGEATTVTEETVVSDVTDIITTANADSSNENEKDKQHDINNTNSENTVEYNLPPDLSVYGTWQIDNQTTLKIKYDRSYVYSVNSKDIKGEWTGKNAISVCGKKALTKTEMTAKEVQKKYGISKSQFNIDNFYYICLPYEYVSFNGAEKVTASDDFNDNLQEFYLYLWNDKDGSLKADRYIYRDNEDSLIKQITLIKGEEA